MINWVFIFVLTACLGEPKDFSDHDGDGYLGASWSDCDDENAAVHRDAEERCDGLDNDCDNVLPSDEADADGDGYMICEGDCDDTRDDVNPGASEVCTDAADVGATDEDCDGKIDDQDEAPLEQTVWYADADGDGFGDRETSVTACAAPPGHVADNSDCDDLAFDSSPNSVERCGDGEDNDCDDQIDEEDADDALSWYRDSDGDGHGDESVVIVSCSVPEGYVSADRSPDCDDADALIHPDVLERCDEIDNDCDVAVDEDDAIDATLWTLDNDGDGYGDEAHPKTSCAAPDGYVAAALGADCDDADTAINPEAAETCNSDDDDCDGDVDEHPAVDAPEWFLDADGDGDGDGAAGVSGYCEAPSGYVEKSTDCDDGDPDTYLGAPESCDTIDQDCDGDTWDFGDYVTVAPSGSGYKSDRNLIMAGIAVAQGKGVGTTLCIAPGTYVETLYLDGGSGDIRVIGQEGASSTIIDAGDAGVPLIIDGAGTTMEVQGLTLTRGFTLDGCGGGLSISGSPTIRELTIKENEAPFGGGMCVVDGAPDVMNTDIMDNVGAFGGGVYIEGGSAVLTQVLVSGNSANPDSDGSGGGLYVVGGDTRLDTVSINANEAKLGAGVYLTGASSVLQADGLRVWSNATTGGEGGAFYLEGTGTSAPSLIATHLDVRGNSATQGGSIFILLDSTAYLQISNAIFAGNKSYAYNMALDLSLASAYITQATFVGNVVETDGGALALYSESSLRNFGVTDSTFYKNVAGDERGLVYVNSTADEKEFLDLFTTCHYEDNTLEDRELVGYGVGNYSGCTPAFADYDSTADPTTWDLMLDGGDTCLTGYSSSGGDIGAYGGTEGSTWPAEDEWP